MNPKALDLTIKRGDRRMPPSARDSARTPWSGVYGAGAQQILGSSSPVAGTSRRSLP